MVSKFFFFCYYFFLEVGSFFLLVFQNFRLYFSLSFFVVAVKNSLSYFVTLLCKKFIRKGLWVFFSFFFVNHLFFIFGTAFVFWDSQILLEERVSLMFLFQEFLLFLETGFVSQSLSKFLDCWFYTIYASSHNY